MTRSVPAILPEILLRSVEEFPLHGVGFINPAGEIQFLNYPDLKEKAYRLLAGFQSLNIRKGEIVILSLDRSIEIIPVLWACFSGGIIPALIQPPVSFSEYNPAAEKAEKVFRILDSPKIIFSQHHSDIWKSGLIPHHKLIDISSVPPARMDPEIPVIFPGDLALIQFSSGSTGDPKGVMLTHRNILCNIEDITKGIKIVPEDRSVNWMPLYHDMGLVGFHITPVYNGCSHFLIEPSDFIKNPFRWLDTISREKITITACPNFGQVLVNRYLSKRKLSSWDLSSLRVLFNGAEPISVSTMNDFINGLEPFGFHPEAMLPAYGMAETTLAAAFPKQFEIPVVVAFDRTELLKNKRAVESGEKGFNVIKLVNLGRPLEHVEVRILDEQDVILPENVIGNVQIRGENVSPGYINYPAQPDHYTRDGWLRTGDLGFIYRCDLFITGRTRDIIFIGGTNYFSHDLETIALQVEDVCFGKVVIGGYFDEKEGRDKLIAFVVGSDNQATRETFCKIRNHFLNIIGLTIDTFIPVRSSDIPYTSSGKIQRYKMIGKFLRGEFPVILII